MVSEGINFLNLLPTMALTWMSVNFRLVAINGGGLCEGGNLIIGEHYFILKCIEEVKSTHNLH